jgi:serine/threonine-protein kinase
VLQACEGLAEAHASGVIHRDLKPSNLFMAKKANGTTVLKVLDFGISKVVPRSGEVAITTTNSLMGSPLYMAPEQMRSSKDVDVRADVWSLGVILYELLAGVAPFEGDSIPEVCLNVMGSPPIPITRFRTDVPNELQAILVKCMEKERENRYPTMGVLARALERFAAQHVRIHAERASAAVKSVRATMATDPEEEYAPPSISSKDVGPIAAVPTLDAGGIAVRHEPDALPSWSAGRRLPPRSRRMWLGLGVATSLIAATLGGIVATRSTTAPAKVAAGPPPAASATPTASPLATADIPSVPFDSLPVAAHDAGASHAATVSARRPAAPPASASAAPKEGWKWGDRN